MSTYRLRFWYCFQETVITGITADELVQSLFFPNNCEMKDFLRMVHLKGKNGLMPIEVSFDSPNYLTIAHLKRDDMDSIDTSLGENNGWTELSKDYWILESE